MHDDCVGVSQYFKMCVCVLNAMRVYGSFFLMHVQKQMCLPVCVWSGLLIFCTVC